jgi:proliferating cell nuclear antigen
MKIVIRDKIKKDQFISILNIIKINSSTVTLIFENDKIHIQGMDKSHICLFDIYINEKWLNEYECLNSDNNICLDTTVFYNIISNVSKNQSIVISNTKNDDSCEINLINEDYKEKENLEFDKNYKIQLNENDYELMNIPESDYNCDFLINSKKIVDITNQMLTFNNDIIIKCSEDCVQFKVDGGNGEMTVKIKTDDFDEFSIEDGEVFNFRYSLQYLSKYCLTKNLSDKIHFSLSKDCPLKIQYDLGDDIDVSFYIAPKVE